MPLLVHHNPVSLDEHKEHLLRNGWSYRAAALYLDVTPQWLNTVLNGWQVSETLAARILALPVCPDHLMSAKARNRMQAMG